MEEDDVIARNDKFGNKPVIGGTTSVYGSEARLLMKSGSRYSAQTSRLHRMAAQQDALSAGLLRLRDAVRATLRRLLWDEAADDFLPGVIDRYEIPTNAAGGLRVLFVNHWRSPAEAGLIPRAEIGRVVSRVMEVALAQEQPAVNSAWASLARDIFRFFPSRGGLFDDALSMAIADMPARSIWFDGRATGRRYIRLTILSRKHDLARGQARDVLQAVIEVNDEIDDGVENEVVPAAAPPEESGAVIHDIAVDAHPVWTGIRQRGFDPAAVLQQALSLTREDGVENLVRNIRILLDSVSAAQSKEKEVVGRLALRYFGADSKQTRNLVSQARRRAAQRIAQALERLGSHPLDENEHGKSKEG